MEERCKQTMTLCFHSQILGLWCVCVWCMERICDDSRLWISACSGSACLGISWSELWRLRAQSERGTVREREGLLCSTHCRALWRQRPLCSHTLCLDAMLSRSEWSRFPALLSTLSFALNESVGKWTDPRSEDDTKLDTESHSDKRTRSLEWTLEKTWSINRNTVNYGHNTIRRMQLFEDEDVTFQGSLKSFSLKSITIRIAINWFVIKFINW